jgi:tellurite methyltransferase
VTGDRERWNERWRSRAGDLSPPAAFCVEHTHLLPRAGRALDVAGGAGRHTVWLARAGLDVTLIDVSDVALERAEHRVTAAHVGARVKYRRIDLTEPGPAGELPTGPFKAIVMFHYLDRARRDEIAALLDDDGLLIAVQPTVTNLERHARPSRNYLVEPGEVAEWATGIGLEAVVSREGWNIEGRHEAELIARRAAVPPRQLPIIPPPSGSGGPYR